jgi:hypothetical protein
MQKRHFRLAAPAVLFQSRAETGLITGSPVLVNDTLLGGLVNQRNCVPEQSFRLSGVTGLDCGPEFAQGGAKAGFVIAVLPRALLGLTGALQRRKMICHVAYFFLQRRFSEDKTSRSFILRGLELVGQCCQPIP